MKNKSRISSLNDKAGGVKDLISAIEQKNSQDSGDEIIIEGDSKGIMEIQYVEKAEDAEFQNSYKTVNSSGDIQDLESHNAEDQINTLIDEYRKNTGVAEETSEVNQGSSEMGDSVDDVNIVDFTAKKVRETVNIPDNSQSAKVLVEDNTGNEAEQTSSVYESDSEANLHIDYKRPTAEASPETDVSKATSTWRDGELLIKTFGYNSNSNTGSNQVSSKESHPNVINNFGDNETLKLSRSEYSGSVHTNNNSITRRKVSYKWKFGDIDGLERASMKTASISEHHPITEDIAAYNLKRDKSVTSTFSRARSVSFKDGANKTYYSGNEKNDDPSLSVSENNINPWKYVCYGILATIALLYVLTLSFKEFFASVRPTIILTERDVFEYFDKSSNGTRDTLFSELAKRYNTKIFDDRNKNTTILKKHKIRYAPRENDKEINVIHNSFGNINSKFEQDVEIKNMMETDDLKFMFSGIAYAPEGVMEPECGATLRNVILDIARLSKITGSVKTYGTQCRQAEFILEAIDQLQLNFTLSMGVWIGSDEATNQAQLHVMKDLIKRYPRKYFRSIFIGNEVIYRKEKTVPELMGYVREAKNYLLSLNITDLPVGVSEIGSQITKEMLLDCDFVGANVHPFFGGVDAQFGTRWVLDYYHNQLLPLKESINTTTEIIISEVGWPYQGGEFIRSVAGSWEYQQFLNDWLCTSPANILNNCFYFEAFDEPWKRIWWDNDRTWETEWGFFTSDRKMKKHIYIPDCSKYGNPSLVDFEYIEEVEDPYANDEDHD